MSTPQPTIRADGILDAVLDLDSSAREVFVIKACDGDLALLAEVRALLAAHEAMPTGFLAQPAMEKIAAGELDETIQSVPVATRTAVDRAGDRIDRYKLREQIGEGGFGTVWMAEQMEPVSRKVALKIIKLGMDTREVIGRFEQERQALAMMDHPNIAKVFDAGTTQWGRPYFVMELVKGIPITQYCDESGLGTGERLALFGDVCSAINHAHQKGIIHRDIKPSNVMVTFYADKPVVKVIDFGIAKATQGNLTDKTLLTRFEQFIGTPVYMSPEQAALSAVDIDTRSDIYALGVLLYELLVGRPPFDSTSLAAAGYEEMRRIIREVEPVKPSSRLSTVVGEERTLLAKSHHIEPERINKLVEPDLDWIVMKALEKDRARRYETANAFALDIRRFLADEPVTATPPSASYKFRKFARRNKTALRLAAAIGALLVAATLISTWQAIRATKAEASQSLLRQQAQNAEATSRRQEALAVANAAEALRQEALSRWRYYDAEMNLAKIAWEAGDVARAVDLLERHRPEAGGTDPRGFEWFHLWRLCHPHLLLTLTGEQPVAGIAYAPDGRTLVSAHPAADLIRLRDAETGATLRVFPCKGWVILVGFTPDGARLVSGGYWDNLFRVWDVRSGQLLMTLKGHQQHVLSMAISPDGQTLATAAQDDAIIFWNLATGEKIQSYPFAGQPVSMAYSNNGSVLAIGADHGAGTPNYEYLPAENGLPARIHVRRVRTLAWHPGDTFLASASNRGSADVYEAGTRKLLPRLTGHEDTVMNLKWAPDGQRLYSCSMDRTVRFWRIDQIGQQGGIPEILGVHRGAATGLAVSPDGQRVATASLDGTVRIWNANEAGGAAGGKATFEIERRFVTGPTRYVWSVHPLPQRDAICGVGPHGAEVIDLSGTGQPTYIKEARGRGALSPNVKLLATGDFDGTVRLWDLALGKLLGSDQRLPQCPAPPSLAFSGDGKLLFAGSRYDGSLQVWDVQEGLRHHATKPMPTTSGITAAAASPDGKWIAAAGRHDLLWLISISDLQIRKTFHPGSGSFDMVAAAFSPDSLTIATAGETGSIYLYNLQSMSQGPPLTGHVSTVHDLSFSPDGQTLASAGNDGTVRFWDVVTAQERMWFRPEKRPITALCFSGGGNTLILANDKRFRILRGGPLPSAE